MTNTIMAVFSNNSTCAIRRKRATERKWYEWQGTRWLFLLLAVVSATGCMSLPERRKDFGFAVILPFMRMDGTECYYLDDFMPTPDNMVVGKSSGLHLRYYTYRSATYKTWESERIMLAFYSRDSRCWSLFEEYSTARI